MKTGQSKAKLHKRLIATQCGYDVFTVDAFGVRDLAKKDEEFTNFATHSEFPDLIGKHEIWIDERLFANEGIFYLVNALTRLKDQERGAAEDRAYVAGLNVERALRERLVGVKFRAGRAHKRVPERLYDRQYATLPDVKFPVQVWLVEGNLARSLYKTDYTEGGHGYVYPWIPKSEIWVEHDLQRAELPYVVAHEYLELRLMRDEGLDYDRAHEICSKVEFDLRRATGPKSLISPDSRKLAKGDLVNLTSEEFYDYVLKHHVKKK